MKYEGMLSALPKSLVDACRAGTLVPFVGAGVSMSVKTVGGNRAFPSWKELLDRAAVRLDAEKESEAALLVRAHLAQRQPDYLQAAKTAKTGLSSLWTRHLKVQFDVPFVDIDPKSLMLATLVWRVAGDLVVTTNYDRVLQWACSDADNLHRYGIESPSGLADILRVNVGAPAVWHIHGHVDGLDDLILTPDGFSELYSSDGLEVRYSAALHTLRTVLASRTLLFVGYSLDDIALTRQIEWVESKFGNSGGPHYVLVRSADRELMQSKLRTQSVKLVEFSDFGPPLEMLLSELAAAAGKPNGSVSGGHNARRSSVVESQINARPIPNNLPHYRTQHFVGREGIIEELEEILCDRERTRFALSIEGMPGVGKTELALQLADRLLRTRAFDGGVFWFDGAAPDLTSTWGGAIAEKLGVVDGNPLEKARAAISFIENTGLRTAVFIDNVEEWDELSHPSPVPSGPHIVLIITTRHSRVGGTRFHRRELGFLARENTRQLLVSVSGRELSSQQGFDELVDYLDGHALTTELAGVYLNRFDETKPADYLNRLMSGAAGNSGKSDRTKHERTVDDALEAIWNRLDAKAKLAWATASFFVSVPASNQLLEACGVKSQARAQLRAFHLIEVDQASSRWRMHNLISQHVQTNIKGKRGFLKRGGVAFLNGMQSVFVNGVDLTNYDFAHKDSAQLQAAIMYSEGAGGVAEVFGFNFAVSLAEMQHYMGLYDESVGRFEELLKKCQGRDFPEIYRKGSIATIKSSFGMLLSDLGQRKRAIEYLRDSLEISVEMYGEGSSLVGRRKNNLGLVLYYAGHVREAAVLFEQSLKTAIAETGDESVVTALEQSNLAMAYESLGMLKPAEELLVKSVRTSTKKNGPRHSIVATSTFNLASVLELQGKLSDALALLESVEVTEVGVYDEKHPSLAVTRARIASVLMQLHRLVDARRYAELAWEAVRHMGSASSQRRLVVRLVHGIIETYAD